MTKRKVGSVLYVGAGTSQEGFEGGADNWNTKVDVDVATGSQRGVAANKSLEVTADVAQRSPLGVAANGSLGVTADVAQRSPLGVAANGSLGVTADVAQRSQLGVVASWHREGTADVENGCGSEEGVDLCTQAASYVAGDRESIYTDFWLVLEDARYEVW